MWINTLQCVAYMWLHAVDHPPCIHMYFFLSVSNIFKVLFSAMSCRLFAIILCSIYMLLSYDVYVPNWKFAASSANTSSYPSYTQTVSQVICLGYASDLSLCSPPFFLYHMELIWSIILVYQVHCEVRGSLQPSCNAVGLIDRTILGEHHLYQRPVYRRTKVTYYGLLS